MTKEIKEEIKKIKKTIKIYEKYQKETDKPGLLREWYIYENEINNLELELRTLQQKK